MPTQLSPWSTDIASLKSTAAKLTDMVNRINSVIPLVGGPGIRVTQRSGHGTSITLDGQFVPMQAIMVKITATETGAGQYAAHSYLPDAVITPATAFTMPSSMVDNGSVDCLVCNLAEAGAAGHVIPLNTYITGITIGYTTETNPRVIVCVNYAMGPNFLAQITGSTLVTSNIWSYTFGEVQTGSTVGTVQTFTGARSGTAYNGMEVGDLSTGKVSAGTTVANFGTGVTLQPIRTGAVVIMNQMSTCATPPVTTYWFSNSNALDGACT